VTYKALGWTQSFIGAAGCTIGWNKAHMARAKLKFFALFRLASVGGTFGPLWTTVGKPFAVWARNSDQFRHDQIADQDPLLAESQVPIA
jgi:hypothetical protein